MVHERHGPSRGTSVRTEAPAPDAGEATSHRPATGEFRDQGRGIPMERRGTLFEPFRTGDGTGSVGFGLAIVRGLVEAHGGRITYMSNQPHGSRFLLELPPAEPDRG